MGLGNGSAIADRFAAYVGELTKVIGHTDRAGPLRDYCSGLLATEGRRSVEPMAAVTAPARVSAQHQSLLHFVANATWPDELMLAKVRELISDQRARVCQPAMPHVLVNDEPGSSEIRASPVRNAFGGQVIGSTARLRRWTPGSWSPLNSMR